MGNNSTLHQNSTTFDPIKCCDELIILATYREISTVRELVNNFSKNLKLKFDVKTNFSSFIKIIKMTKCLLNNEPISVILK